MTWRFDEQPTTRATSAELAAHMAAATALELCEALTSQEPEVRELAAAYLGDQLVSACKAQVDTTPIVDSLVIALSRESDADAQEEIANALANLVEYGTVPTGIVEPLRRCLSRLGSGAAEHVQDLLKEANAPS